MRMNVLQPVLTLLPLRLLLMLYNCRHQWQVDHHRWRLQGQVNP
jgi:hypothetical protein